jgi:hypothetical protein
MTEMNDTELEPPVHSTATLIKAVVFSMVLAAVVLTVAILPAEYGIDPTGIGRAVGLTKLSGAQQQPSPQATPSKPGSQQEDTVDITVPPGKGLEYKFHVVEGDKLHYAWTAKGGGLYFDFHGEPEGDTTGYFESYTIAASDEMRGVLTAPFTGSHGWYWKNKNSVPVVVTLMTEGKYKVIGLK